MRPLPPMLRRVISRSVLLTTLQRLPITVRVATSSQVSHQPFLPPIRLFHNGKTHLSNVPRAQHEHIQKLDKPLPSGKTKHTLARDDYYSAVFVLLTGALAADYYRRLRLHHKNNSFISNLASMFLVVGTQFPDTDLSSFASTLDYWTRLNEAHNRLHAISADEQELFRMAIPRLARTAEPELHAVLRATCMEVHESIARSEGGDSAAKSMSVIATKIHAGKSEIMRMIVRELDKRGAREHYRVVG